ncbi:MAG: DUF1232 domain-containing protein [Gammaproteobacteria bacterium]|nr:DUF1232 domain-containing protein [Gammaproteobacteria bacterium]
MADEHERPVADEPRGFEKEYSEDDFWKKVCGYARTAGREVVELALQLYYAAQSPDTPHWAKAAIYGALGYFISVVDAIPDITPIVGYTDDLGVLVAALAAVARNVTPEIKERAAFKAREWFPE